LRPDQDDTCLYPRKRRIIESAKREPDHRDAIVTTGREIENDIPPVVLKQAAASLLGIQATTLDGCEITGNRRYWEEIADALPPESRDRARVVLQAKPKLARDVIRIVDEKAVSLGKPDYIDRILTIIRRSASLGDYASHFRVIR